MRRSDRLAAKATARVPASAAKNEQTPLQAPEEPSGSQKLPLPPDLALCVVESLPNVLDACHAAAGLALLGFFGPHPGAYLEDFWIKQLQNVQRSDSFLRGPFLDRESLIKAARRGGRRKRDLRNMTTAEIAAVVPSYVPPALVWHITYENVRWRRQRWIERRRARLRAALAARGLELRVDSRLCDAYILRGEGSAQEIAAIMHEMDFLYKHTTYAEDLADWEEIYAEGCEDHNRAAYMAMHHHTIRQEAKNTAFKKLMARVGREGILTLPNLPPEIRLVSQGAGGAAGQEQHPAEPESESEPEAGAGRGYDSDDSDPYSEWSYLEWDWE
jgi:hypothetical protein